MFLFKFSVTLTAVHSKVYIRLHMACLTYHLNYNPNIVTGRCGIRTGMSSIFSIGYIEERLQASNEQSTEKFYSFRYRKTWPNSHRHHILIQYHSQFQQL